MDSDDLLRVVPENRVASFTDFAVRLNFFLEDQNRKFRFTHLLLGDALAGHYTVLALHDADVQLRREAVEILYRMQRGEAFKSLMQVDDVDDLDLLIARLSNTNDRIHRSIAAL